RRGRDRQDAPQHYADEFVVVDFAQRVVRAGGEEVSLTPLEFRLLTAFVRHPNQVLSHDQLVEQAWGGAGSAERDQVKLYVGYLPGSQRQVHADRGARILRALDLDPAAVALDDRLRDRQAQAGPGNRVLGRVRAAEEPLEEPLLLVDRDAEPGVLDFEDGRTV